MKIGICVRTWGERGGIGSYTRSVVSKIVELDQKNDYLLFYSEQKYAGTFRNHANVRDIVVSSKNKLLWDQISVPLLAQKEKVDVIFHTKFSVPLLSPKKTVMVLHGTERFYYPDFHPKSDRIYFRTIYPQYLKRASVIIAVSDRARLDILDLLKLEPAKVKTVYLAADPIFRVLEDEEYLDNIQKKYSLTERFILYVGHIYPGKNVGRLFRAFAKIRKNHPVGLVVAGTYRWKYQKEMGLIDELNLNEHVHLAGHVPPEDLVGLYNLAELTVFPSFYESFGIPNVEANACGCPLVTSCTGGSIEAAGDAAIYIDPLDVDEIADAMERVLTDEALRSDLIEKGFRNAKRFSWEKTAKMTLEVLESIRPA